MTENSGFVAVKTSEIASIDELLPLIEDYQRFYGVEPNHEHNKAFFTSLLDSKDQGMMLEAKFLTGSIIVGYACLHWRLDTVSARSVVCLHDLYVSPEHRRKRVGDALLKAAAANAYLRGAEALVWTTAPDNTGAQALYDSAGATRSSWIEYELSLESPSKYLWQ